MRKKKRENDVSFFSSTFIYFETNYETLLHLQSIQPTAPFK